MAGEGAGVVDLELIYVNAADPNREMGRDGSGKDDRWLGLAEPGEHRGGALERDTEAQTVAVAVLLHCRFIQRGQRAGQVAVADADGASQRQREAVHTVEGSGTGQGEAVLDERAGGLWFLDPDRGAAA